MNNLISEEHRVGSLLSFKIPLSFLKVIEQDIIKYNIGIVTPTNFYKYSESILKTIKVKGNSSIIPICENANENIYYLLFINQKDKSFVKYGLEYGILKEYKLGFYELLADILISAYENYDTVPINKLSDIGKKLGANFSEKLFKSLEQATLNRKRNTFESDANWRKKNIPKIINNNYEES